MGILSRIVNSVRGYLRPEMAPVKTKHRRVKNGVAKVSRKQNGLSQLGRDTANSWWNMHQRLVDKKDPVCSLLSEQIQAVSGDYISPLQIAGWFSELCRNGMLTEVHRQEIIRRRLRAGSMTVEPEYGAELLRAIKDNYDATQADKAAREAAHSVLKVKKQAVLAKRLEVGIQERLL